MICQVKTRVVGSSKHRLGRRCNSEYSEPCIPWKRKNIKHNEESLATWEYEQQNRACSSSRNIVALQVTERMLLVLRTPRATQMFLLQRVERDSTSCNKVAQQNIGLVIRVTKSCTSRNIVALQVAERMLLV